MTDLIEGCRWTVEKFSGFGRQSTTQAKPEQLRCRDCTTNYASKECEDFRREFRAEPITLRQMWDMVPASCMPKPRPERPVIPPWAFGEIQDHDEDGGLPQEAVLA